MHLSTARRLNGIFNPSKGLFLVRWRTDRAMKERESQQRTFSCKTDEFLLHNLNTRYPMGTTRLQEIHAVIERMRVYRHFFS